MFNLPKDIIGQVDTIQGLQHTPRMCAYCCARIHWCCTQLLLLTKTMNWKKAPKYRFIGQIYLQIFRAKFPTIYNEINHILPSKIFQRGPNLNPDNKRIHKLPKLSSMCMWQSGLPEHIVSVAALSWLMFGLWLHQQLNIGAQSTSQPIRGQNGPITLDSAGMLCLAPPGMSHISLNKPVKDYRSAIWTWF